MRGDSEGRLLPARSRQIAPVMSLLGLCSAFSLDCLLPCVRGRIFSTENSLLRASAAVGGKQLWSHLSRGKPPRTTQKGCSRVQHSSKLRAAPRQPSLALPRAPQPAQRAGHQRARLTHTSPVQPSCARRRPRPRSEAQPRAAAAFINASNVSRGRPGQHSPAAECAGQEAACTVTPAGGGGPYYRNGLWCPRVSHL